MVKIVATVDAIVRHVFLSGVGNISMAWTHMMNQATLLASLDTRVRMMMAVSWVWTNTTLRIMGRVASSMNVEWVQRRPRRSMRNWPMKTDGISVKDNKEKLRKILPARFSALRVPAI